MGRIRFKYFYTDLVEHYLRMAVRYETVSNASSQHWFDITKHWIDELSKEDNQFIQFVFGKQFFNTAEGLYCYQCSDDMHLKRIRLAKLERDFAFKCGLIGENSTDDNTL